MCVCEREKEGGREGGREGGERERERVSAVVFTEEGEETDLDS